MQMWYNAGVKDLGILKEEGGEKSMKFAKIKGWMGWADYTDINETRLWETSYWSNHEIINT